jgi:hypothetical protein
MGCRLSDDGVIAEPPGSVGRRRCGIIKRVLGRRNRGEPELVPGSQSFVDEQRREDRVSLQRTVVRWGLAFAVIFAVAALAFWWSGSALRYSAARVERRNAPTYHVTGIVTDGRTHHPIPWAEISTDFEFGGAFFSTSTDQYGRYSINTLAEPHHLIVKANGYQAARIQVGRRWFWWTPRGSERRDTELVPLR